MFESMKLGKLAPSNDERNLKLANYTAGLLPAAPTKVNYTTHVQAWPMYANDRLGDCTCAAVGHMVEAWTSFNTPWLPAEKEVTDLYWATGKQDTGRVETQVLNYWRKNGFGDRKDKITGYAQVNPLNHTEVKQAMWLFGGLYIGVALPITAQSQREWKVVHDGYNSQPGSWGGHAINVVAYDHLTLTVVTWGALMKMTWGFWNKYVDEAYAVLSSDWTAGKTAPSGFDFATLQNDLAAL